MTFKTTRKTVKSGNSIGITFPSSWNIKGNCMVNVSVWKTEEDNPTIYEATLKVCYRGHVYGVHLPAVWGIGLGEMVTAEVDLLENEYANPRIDS